MTNGRRASVPAVVAAVVVVAGAGIALASYQTLVAPTGTGAATPAPARQMTFDVTGTVSAGLYPGGPGASVTVTVANPYDRAITVTGIAAAGAIAATPLPGSTCATTAITVVAPSSGLPFTVAASSTSNAVTLPGVVTMGAAAESGCQGATFTVPMTVTGQL